ncbi:MAG: DUF6457 domain-containing protein [Candidatus Limnocylindria bacterium]
MTDAERPTQPLADWLARLREELGGSEVGLELTPAEQRALLDLARVAAHSSERIAAPLTTFLAGVTWAGVDAKERAKRLRALVDRLEGLEPSPPELD